VGRPGVTLLWLKTSEVRQVASRPALRWNRGRKFQAAYDCGWDFSMPIELLPFLDPIAESSGASRGSPFYRQASIRSACMSRVPSRAFVHLFADADRRRRKFSL